MKLLLVADIFPPQSGGPATYVVELANAFVKQGVDVQIVSLNPTSDTTVASCPVIRVSWKNKLLRYLEYFWLLFQKAKYVNVVYAMGPVNAGLPALVAARLRGKKFVVKVVGDYAWEQYQGAGLDLYTIDEFQTARVGGKIGWLKRVESFVVRHADHVITPCAYLKRLVVGWGAEEKNVSVIYNAIAIPSVTPKVKPAGEKWVVSIGRDVPWKGMKTLSELSLDFPKNVKLKIVSGASRQEALCTLASADVFVLNSGYEGLSHALLEAVALGVPVLASDVGGNPEVVPSDHLFPYDDRAAIARKIVEMLAAPRRLSPLGREFQFVFMIERTQKLLESVCQL